MNVPAVAMKHVMIDIETLGARPGSVIATIGAVAFDPVAGTIDDVGIHVLVDVVDAQRRGLRIEADTFLWWLKQSTEARDALIAYNPLSLISALGELSAFCRLHDTIHPWGHGVGFDIVLLESAYFACGDTAPWKFWNARDTRTIFALTGINPKEFFEPGATAHNALDDARAQAKAVIAAYAKLGLSRPITIDDVAPQDGAAAA